MNQFENKELASEAGKLSSRKGIPNVRTAIYKRLIERANERKRNGQKDIVLEDFRQTNYEDLLELDEIAETWQEKFLIRGLIAKLLHTQKLEVTGKDGKDFIESIEIKIIESKRDTST